MTILKYPLLYLTRILFINFNIWQNVFNDIMSQPSLSLPPPRPFFTLCLFRSGLVSFQFNLPENGNQKFLNKINDLNFKQRMNELICADCGASDPAWASLNHGVLICSDCCFVHRNLGYYLNDFKRLKI